MTPVARLALRLPAGIGTAARLVLGGVFAAAGLLKLPDPAASVRAVRAYELLPEPLAQVVGHGLPVLEVGLGVLLLAGLATRFAAAVTGLLLVAFLVGVGSAAARGLSIDCGCFGGGGASADASDYALVLLRDVGLLLAAGLLVLRPDTAWSVDRWLHADTSGTTDTPGTPETPEAVDAAARAEGPR